MIIAPIELPQSSQTAHRTFESVKNCTKIDDDVEPFIIKGDAPRPPKVIHLCKPHHRSYHSLSSLIVCNSHLNAIVVVADYETTIISRVLTPKNQ